MISTTIKRIEDRLLNSNLSEENRGALTELLATLREEVDQLSESDEEKAQSIAGFTEVSTHEATRDQRDEGLLDTALSGLSSSVKELEASHPKLFGVVNAVCHRLSELGI